MGNGGAQFVGVFCQSLAIYKKRAPFLSDGACCSAGRRESVEIPIHDHRYINPIVVSFTFWMLSCVDVWMRGCVDVLVKDDVRKLVTV